LIFNKGKEARKKIVLLKSLNMLVNAKLYES